MKSKNQLVQDAFKLANETIPTSKEHIYVAFDKGKNLAEYYKADVDIVLIGIYLMDYKLKEARKLEKKQEHVNMAVQFAKDFLKNYNITKDEKEKIINCIEAHHGKIPFQCIEAEICANADCYRFLSPTGVLSYICFLTTKLNNLEAILLKVKEKMDEKYKILSLNQSKKELEESYQMFSKIFNNVLENHSSDN